MRRIALLVAAALIFSAPLVVNFITDAYAATAKKAKKQATRVKTERSVTTERAPQGGERPYDFNSDPNTAFIRALSDLFSGKQGASRTSATPGGSKGKAATKSGTAPKGGAGASRGGTAGPSSE